MSAERIAWRDLAPQRWKNGAGVTRELAVEPRGASMEDFEWRISVAELTQDAPFSAFAGVDRCIALLKGAGMTLHSADYVVVHRLDRVGEPFHFAGELPLAARLVNGTCEDFNVMVRRGVQQVQMTRITQDETLGSALAGLVLCVAGRWQCADAVLEPGQALMWRSGMPTMRLQPQTSPSLAVAVHLRCSPGATRDAATVGATPGCTRATT